MNLRSNVRGEPAQQQGIVQWRGASAVEFPWGSKQRREITVYRADDAPLELSSLPGEAATTVRLNDRTLGGCTVLDTHSHQKTFCLEVRHELIENGTLIRNRKWQSTVPRVGQQGLSKRHELLIPTRPVGYL